ADRVFDAITSAFAREGLAAPARIPVVASDGAGQLY
ncbi:MAG: hypothetical protein JWM76_2799, partial [Pseudonocardiales bacterium]|nr:hypothetical protein [Pseudonocardiales bacterium]